MPQAGHTTVCAFCGAAVSSRATPRLLCYVPPSIAFEHERWCPFVVTEGFSSMERLDDLLTVAQAADLAEVGTTEAIRMAIRRGAIPATQDATTGRYTIRYGDLVPYLVERRRERSRETEPEK